MSTEPAKPFPTSCQVHPRVLDGIEERCPLRVRFHHEIVLEEGLVARSSSCAVHLFEAAAGLLKAIMAAHTEPERVRSINVSQVVDSRTEAGENDPGRSGV